MKPHFEAVLTTRTALPFTVLRGKGLPFSVFFLLVGGSSSSFLVGCIVLRWAV